MALSASKLCVLLLVRLWTAETKEAVSTCGAGQCEDTISLIQQSSSFKKRADNGGLTVGFEGSTPAGFDVQALTDKLKDVVNQHHSNDQGSQDDDEEPENITIVVSLPTAFPLGLAPGVGYPTVNPYSTTQPSPQLNHFPGTMPASRGGPIQHTHVSDRQTPSNSGAAAAAPDARNNAVITHTSGVIPLAKTTPPPNKAFSAGSSYFNAAGSAQLAGPSNVQAQVAQETQEGIKAGITAGMIHSEETIEAKIAEGVRKGIQQGIAAGLAAQPAPPQAAPIQAAPAPQMLPPQAAPPQAVPAQAAPALAQMGQRTQTPSRTLVASQYVQAAAPAQ